MYVKDTLSDTPVICDRFIHGVIYSRPSIDHRNNKGCVVLLDLYGST